MSTNKPLSSLPGPVALVLAGGASLGAIQVGMLRRASRRADESD